MKIRNKEKLISVSIFVLCILFQLVCMVIINAKTLPSGDEWFTYGLANNTQEGPIFMDRKWITQKTDGTGWIPTELMRDYLVVNEGEEFDFATVISNQKRDVHPPLYYILVHVFCSLDSGNFNMLQSGMVNFLSLIGLNILLWKMGKYFFATLYERVLPVFALCFSSVTVLLIGYDRMYALLAFFCLLITYLQLRLAEDTDNRKVLCMLAGTTCLGCLTHYYFYMYLFAAFVVYAVEQLLISKKKNKTILPCVGAHCAGGIVALVLYPTAIRHMLFSYRGEEIRDGLFDNKLESFATYYRIVNEYFFRGYMPVVLVIIVISLVIGLKYKKIEFGKNYKNSFLLWGTLFFFCFIIAFISHETLWQYVSPGFALIILGICMVLLLAAWFIPQKWKVPAVMLLLLFLCGNRLMKGVESALDTDEYNQEITTMLQTQEGRDCVFVYESWNNLFNNRILDLMHFDEVLTVPLEELESTSMAQQLNTRKTEDELVVYLWDQDNDRLEEQIAHIEGDLGKEASLLFSSRKFSVFSMN